MIGKLCLACQAPVYSCTRARASEQLSIRDSQVSDVEANVGFLAWGNRLDMLIEFIRSWPASTWIFVPGSNNRKGTICLATLSAPPKHRLQLRRTARRSKRVGLSSFQEPVLLSAALARSRARLFKSKRASA